MTLFVRFLCDQFEGPSLATAFAIISTAPNLGSFLAGFVLPTAMVYTGWRCIAFPQILCPTA